MAFLDFFARASKKELPVTPKGSFVASGGTVVTPDTAMKVSAFFRGVIYISTQIGKLPWVVKDANNNLMNTNITTLLKLAPNDEMNSFMFRVLAISTAIIKGNFYAEIERDLIGRPVAMWPLKSENVELVRLNDGRLYYKVIGGNPLEQGEDTYLRTNDVFHIKNFFTKDGLSGEGLIYYASETLGIGLGADRFANGLYANGAMPSGILSVPTSLSDEAFERLKESWKESHGGRKVGGVAVLEEGSKFDPISLDPNVLQFLESRKFTVLEIARFIGLPPTKLYDGDSATYNNIEHSNLEVAVDTLDAWARNLEMEADIKLLSKGFNGRRSEIDIYSVFRGDMKTRSEYFTARMGTASISPNEIRKMEGDAPYDGGDRYFIQSNNYTPMDRLDEELDLKKEAIENKNKTQEDEKKANEAVTNYLNSKI